MNLAKKRKTYIFTTSRNKNKISYFKKKKIKIIQINKLINEQDFFLLLKKIYKLGKTRVLVEAGPTFLKKLIMFNLINYLYIFKSNILLKKNGFKKFVSHCIKRCTKNNKVNVNLENDELFSIKLNNV